MGTTYQRGYNFEHRVKNDLERRGFMVFRSGASKNMDLIGVKRNDEKKGCIVAFVECKYNTSKANQETLTILSDKAKSVGAVPVYAHADARKGIEYYYVFSEGTKMHKVLLDEKLFDYFVGCSDEASITNEILDVYNMQNPRE
jgi:Holliday junction resolvase